MPSPPSGAAARPVVVTVLVVAASSSACSGRGTCWPAASIPTAATPPGSPRRPTGRDGIRRARPSPFARAPPAPRTALTCALPPPVALVDDRGLDGPPGARLEGGGDGRGLGARRPADPVRAHRRRRRSRRSAGARRWTGRSVRRRTSPPACSGSGTGSRRRSRTTGSSPPSPTPLGELWVPTPRASASARAWPMGRYVIELRSPSGGYVRYLGLDLTDRIAAPVAPSRRSAVGLAAAPSRIARSAAGRLLRDLERAARHDDRADGGDPPAVGAVREQPLRRVEHVRAATAPRPPGRRSRAARTRGPGRSPPVAGRRRTAARRARASRARRGTTRCPCRRTPGRPAPGARRRRRGRTTAGGSRRSRGSSRRSPGGGRSRADDDGPPATRAPSRPRGAGRPRSGGCGSARRSRARSRRRTGRGSRSPRSPPGCRPAAGPACRAACRS